MRVLTSLALLVVLAACDSASDIVPISDDMIVELTDEGLLRVSTEGYNYCGVPIYVDSETRSRTLDVLVRGAARVTVVCEALVAGTWAIGVPPGDPVTVRVHHRGSIDQYEIRSTDQGRELVALRTSTTRPGPR